MLTNKTILVTGGTGSFGNLNKSHTEKEAKAYLEATDKAFALIKQAVEKDSLEGILRGGKVDPVFKRNIK